MPELPEVETVVRGLRRVITNQIIEKLDIIPPKIARVYFRGEFQKLIGDRLTAVRRRGKNILIDTKRGRTLWVHLKMTGHFYYLPKTTARDPHDHLVIYFRGNDYSLRFNDYRRFGYVRLLNTRDIMEQKELAELGPEPLEISRADFVSRFRRGKRMIKPALLDQTFLAGLGNIYADESLYLARLNPRRQTDTISEKKLSELHGIIRKLLTKAINKMGTSVDTFAGVDGRPGGFQKYLAAYGRENEPCRRCGTKIRRVKIGSRSSHYCPRCQRL